MDKQLYELLCKFIEYAEGTLDIDEDEFLLFIEDAKKIIKLYEDLYIN